MAVNPNLIPWLSILGVAGAVVGYLWGRWTACADPMIPALVGLCAGTFAGLVLRVVLRLRWARRGGSDGGQSV